MIGSSALVVGAVAGVVSGVVAPSVSALPQYPEPQYINTMGNVRCVISPDRVSCEQMGSASFTRVPAGGNGHVASMAADGTFTWADAGIGAATTPEVAIRTRPYRYQGWSILLAPDGTRLTNILSLHGMLISLDGAKVTPY